MKGIPTWAFWIVVVAGVGLAIAGLVRVGGLGASGNIVVFVVGIGLVLGGVAAVLATIAIRRFPKADSRVARFVPPAVALLGVFGVGAIGAAIFAIGAASSSDSRDFLERRFASIRRDSKRFFATAKGDELAAYRAIAASSSERFEPFATFDGSGNSALAYDHTLACVDGELIGRGASRPIAAIVVGDRHGDRLELRITEIGVDRRCTCHGGARNDPLSCALE